MEKRIIIAGSRTFTNDWLVSKTLDAYLLEQDDDVNVTIISGGARGADALGERYAAMRGFPVIRMPADWEQFDRAAGPIRNEQMAMKSIEGGAVGVLFAFWDGVSRGTASMIRHAKAYGLEVHVIRTNG